MGNRESVKKEPATFFGKMVAFIKSNPKISGAIIGLILALVAVVLARIGLNEEITAQIVEIVRALLVALGGGQ